MGQKLTGRENLAIVYFIAGVSQGRDSLLDARFPIAQAHILTRPYKTPRFGISGMTILSIIIGGSYGMFLLIQYDL